VKTERSKFPRLFHTTLYDRLIATAVVLVYYLYIKYITGKYIPGVVSLCAYSRGFVLICLYRRIKRRCDFRWSQHEKLIFCSMRTYSLSTLSQKSATICRRKVRLSPNFAVLGDSLTSATVWTGLYAARVWNSLSDLVISASSRLGSKPTCLTFPSSYTLPLVTVQSPRSDI